MNHTVATTLMALALLGSVPLARAAGADTPQAMHAGHGPAIDRARLPTPVAGSADERIKATTVLPSPSAHGEFRTVCGYSHMAFDDPIVFPGQPGKSHLHVFFGNTGTNAYSTAETIAGSGNSTCHGGIANRTGYWVPATIDTRSGSPVKPAQAVMYYKNGYDGIRADEVQPFPKGLRMIAGDATNTSPKGPWRFVCVYRGGDNKEHREIPDCPVGSLLFQNVFFPQCWDGRNLDSPDHKSHMSYPLNHRCPESHPVPLPQITFNIQYEVREPGTSRFWRLASDMYASDEPAGRSMHGDWWNGWSPAVEDAWVRGCNQAARDCHGDLLGDGRQIY
jgi:hypothetical protein